MSLTAKQSERIERENTAAAVFSWDHSSSCYQLVLQQQLLSAGIAAADDISWDHSSSCDQLGSQQQLLSAGITAAAVISWDHTDD